MEKDVRQRFLEMLESGNFTFVENPFDQSVGYVYNYDDAFMVIAADRVELPGIKFTVVPDSEFPE